MASAPDPDNAREAHQMWLIVCAAMLVALVCLATKYLVPHDRPDPSPTTRRDSVRVGHLVIGSYLLERELGVGGAGRVFLGRHLLLGRPAAIKLIKENQDPQADTTVALKRFEREVRTTGRLSNPHTVVIYDYGVTPGGRSYYAMEYLDGFSLETMISEHGPIHDGRAIYLMHQVCSSIAEAHQAGVIHRDLKPENVMVCHRGGIPDFIKVLDFGLAKSMLDSGDTPRAMRHSVVGTPLYLAPELLASPRDADARSDVYALGGILYFLLTGLPPFPTENLSKLFEQHKLERPIKPSARGARCAADLDAVVLACLAKSPEERPSSALDLQRRLEACQTRYPWAASAAEAWWHQVSIG